MVIYPWNSSQIFGKETDWNGNQSKNRDPKQYSIVIISQITQKSHRKWLELLFQRIQQKTDF